MSMNKRTVWRMLIDRLYACPASRCSNRKKSKLKEFDLHLKTVHPGKSLVVCPTAGCKRRYVSISGLKRHLAESHPDAAAQTVQRKTSRAPCVCGTCGLTCLNKARLGDHCRTVHRERAYFCELCGQAFTNAYNKKRHMADKSCSVKPRMSSSAASTSTSCPLQHSIKQEVKHEDECWEPDVQCEPDTIYAEVYKFEEDYKEGIKGEAKCEEEGLNVKAEIIDSHSSDIVKCSICVSDFCEHIRFADCTTVKAEPVDDAIRLEELNENEEVLPAEVLSPPVQKSNKYLYCSQLACVYKSYRNQNLLNHIRAKHRDEHLNFSCSRCAYQCDERQKLQPHNRVKHSEGEYLISDYKCNGNCYNLQRHVRAIHSGEYLYLFSCYDCNYHCNQKRRLQEHIREKHTKNQARILH